MQWLKVVARYMRKTEEMALHKESRVQIPILSGLMLHPAIKGLDIYFFQHNYYKVKYNDEAQYSCMIFYQTHTVKLRIHWQHTTNCLKEIGLVYSSL